MHTLTYKTKPRFPAGTASFVTMGDSELEWLAGNGRTLLRTHGLFVDQATIATIVGPQFPESKFRQYESTWDNATKVPIPGDKTYNLLQALLVFQPEIMAASRAS